MKYIRIFLFVASISVLLFAIAGCQKSTNEDSTNTVLMNQRPGGLTAIIQQRAHEVSHVTWAVICPTGSKLIVNEDGTLSCLTNIIWPPSDIKDSQIKWNPLVVVACPNNKPGIINNSGQTDCQS